MNYLKELYSAIGSMYCKGDSILDDYCMIDCKVRQTCDCLCAIIVSIHLISARNRPLNNILCNISDFLHCVPLVTDQVWEKMVNEQSKNRK